MKQVHLRDNLQGRIDFGRDAALRFCPVPGCGRAPQARAKTGFSLTHCRYHVQAKNRFGSYWKRNIPAVALNPYKWSVEQVLYANAGDEWVAAALCSLRCLMEGAGPNPRIVDVNSLLKPREKARASLARLRDADIKPEALLATYISVAAAIEEDPIKPGGEPGEYLRVQAAKRVFRMKSGQHTVYGPGVRWDRYPRSSGLALRHLGSMLEECCEHVHSRFLDEVLRLKREADAARSSRCSTKNEKVKDEPCSDEADNELRYE